MERWIKVFIVVIGLAIVYAVYDDAKNCLRHEQRGWVTHYYGDRGYGTAVTEPNMVCVERRK